VFKSIGILRNDHLGDLILTIPLVLAVKRIFPHSNISLIVSPAQKDISLILDLDVKWLLLDRKLPLTHIIEALKKEHLDTILEVYPNFKMSLCSYLARIPMRVGYAYKPSGIFANKKVYVHRSRPLIHESSFALEFLKRIKPESFLDVNTLKHEIPLCIEEDLKLEAKKLLKEQGLIKKDKNIVAIHPGFGGSALNWPIKRYAELITDLSTNPHISLVLTGSLKEKDVLTKIRSEARLKLPLICGLKLSLFAAVLTYFQIFIAPSTGVLHLADILGIRTIGIYSPLKAHSPKKWGPLKNSTILIPKVPCKTANQKMRSIPQKQRDNIMANLSALEVVSTVLKLINT